MIPHTVKLLLFSEDQKTVNQHMYKLEIRLLFTVSGIRHCGSGWGAVIKENGHAWLSLLAVLGLAVPAMIVPLCSSCR